MASEQIVTSVPAPPAAQPAQPLQAWLARLGLSGKLLAAGGLIGLIAVFLPLLSMSLQLPTPGGTDLLGGRVAVNLPSVSTSHSVLVVRDFRGTLCLVGYLATLALAWVLYPPNGLSPKALGWAGVGVGTLLALLALWLLATASNGSAGLAAFGGSFQISIGFGAIFNLLAAATVAVGGFLKAREEKLI